MQAGEGQLHLRLHARRADDPAALRPPGQVVEQRGLARARLAVQHQHPALAARTASANRSSTARSLRLPRSLAAGLADRPGLAKADLLAAS